MCVGCLNVWDAARFVTLGSRGDVDPFLALAGALIARGHQVRLVTQPDLAAGADGVELYRIDLGPTGDLLDLPAAKRLLRRPFDPRAIRQLMDALEPGFEMLYRATVSAVAVAVGAVWVAGAVVAVAVGRGGVVRG